MCTLEKRVFLRSREKARKLGQKIGLSLRFLNLFKVPESLVSVRLIAIQTSKTYCTSKKPVIRCISKCIVTVHFISFFNSNAIYIQYGADGFVKGTVEYQSLRTLQARICRESPFTNPSWIILENKVDATHRTLPFRRTGVGRAHKYGARDGVPGGFSGQSPEPSERRLPLFYL